MVARTNEIAKRDMQEPDESPMCPTNCTAFHSKEDFARRVSLSRRTIYNYVRQGLPVGRKGRIYCPDGRAWLNTKKQRTIKEETGA